MDNQHSFSSIREGRYGLPGWSYLNEELFTLERDLLFKRHWQLVCHLNDIPNNGDFRTLDLVGERALVIRGKDGAVRAFHNLCRHRASRVVADDHGTCPGVITCPFHAWSYDLDGRLRAPAQPSTFPKLDQDEWGLFSLEMEIWRGFVFVRFQKGPQPSIAEIMAPHETEIAPYQIDDMIPAGGNGIYHTDPLPINWKSSRDVDNEGYHVAMAHPSLNDLYGDAYYDDPMGAWTSRSVGEFNTKPARLWSVRNYRNLLQHIEAPWADLPKQWIYVGIYPNTVFAFYPDSIIFYQDIPHSVSSTSLRGGIYHRREESRALKAARYLSGKIDLDTVAEDQQLMIWSQEAIYSSAFDGIILSDLEAGVGSYHDRLRQDIPIMSSASEPLQGMVSKENDAMIASQTASAE